MATGKAAGAKSPPKSPPPRSPRVDDRVKVVVRMRPLEPGQAEGARSDGRTVQFDLDDAEHHPILKRSPSKQRVTGARSPPGSLSRSSSSRSLGRPATQREYTFDRVFLATTTQEMLFNEQVEPMIEQALEGFNVTVFAYGQTGSGKTYTMTGPGPDVPGVIPRTVHKIFALINEKETTQYVVTCSYVELYNNEFKDLLAYENDPDNRGKFAVQTMKRAKIELHETADKRIVMSGSATLNTPVTSEVQLLALVEKGNRAKVMSHTNQNTHSSRGHTILTLTLESRDTSDATARVRVSKLHLIDLAGSESLRITQASGNTLKETQNINSSLAALGDVFSALFDRDKNPKKVIPYRNSKLTRLLQDSLGGNAKTLMIAHIQSNRYTLRETASTLMYATRAKRIRNRPMVNVDVQGSSELSAVSDELDELRKRLAVRTEEMERLQSSQATTQADRDELERKLRELLQCMDEDRAAFDRRVDAVIHSHTGTLELERQKLEEAQGVMESRLSLMQSEIERARTEAQELRQEKLTLKNELSRVKTETEEARAQVEELARSKAQQAEANQRMERQMQRMRDAVQEEKSAASAELSVLGKEIAAAQEERSRLQAAVESLQQELRQRDHAIADLTQRNQSLSADLDRARAMVVQQQLEMQRRIMEDVKEMQGTQARSGGGGNRYPCSSVFLAF